MDSVNHPMDAVQADARQRARAVVEDCLRAGVGEFVICAGARNAALVEAITAAEATVAGLRVWTHFEERSAGFFALGRTMATGNPCAVVTTSGTAAAELLPAVVEAFMQAKPLVCITADRPEEARGSGAPQTIVQPGLFGCYSQVDDLASWSGKQPIHLNVCLGEDEQTSESINCSIQDSRPVIRDVNDSASYFGTSDCNFNYDFSGIGTFRPEPERLDVAGLARWLREGLYRGMVVMVGGLEPEDREEVFHFCKDYGAPLVVDAASGLRELLDEGVIHDSDRVLASRPPGKVLRLGEVPTGRFWRDLEHLPGVDVWSVCRNGLRGLARKDAKVIEGGVARVLRALGEPHGADDALDHLEGDARRVAMADELLQAYPDSEPGLVSTLSQLVCLGSGLFLGNSLPVREWGLFAQRRHPIDKVRANRGANGIDGQVSTWLGCSADEEDAWALVGDLTALYDAAAPFLLRQVETRGRVLAVINNCGGRIFDRVANVRELPAVARARMRNAHEADFSGLATLWGMRHLRICCSDDFDRLDAEGPPLLLELLPDEVQTRDFWAAWDAASPQVSR